MIKLSLPGRDWSAELNNLILDLNGTVTTDGQLLPGVKEKVEMLKDRLEIYIVTADTRGTGFEAAEKLGVHFFKVSDNDGAHDKLDFVNTIIGEETIVIGNGYNDHLALEHAALSIVVIGEGCAVQALKKADIAVKDINDALDLLLNPLRIVATLRA
jgi:P-type E1-E2 ATPase